MNDTTSLLELVDVKKVYPGAEGGPDLKVLHDVSLVIHPGDSVSVAGPSGSGKSTLLNLMGSLDQPTEGQVIFQGKDLSRTGDQELSALRNRSIGFIFQDHRLLPQLSLLENVLLPVLAWSRNTAGHTERAHTLLKRVGLQDRLHHRPGQLSGGERQRVAVVRALINKPSILLADEPTGALDAHTADALGALLVDLNREEGVALVVVTHALSLARRMGRQYRLHEGQLTAIADETDHCEPYSRHQ